MRAAEAVNGAKRLKGGAMYGSEMSYHAHRCGAVLSESTAVMERSLAFIRTRQIRPGEPMLRSVTEVAYDRFEHIV
jgi:hypothetical protein